MIGKPKDKQRHVFSVNVVDEDVAEYIEEMSARHPRGVSGYMRDLVLLDRARYRDAEELRNSALAKLTDNERAALGYPVIKENPGNKAK
jgi:hypothetical protein